jgi:hypothetical protein
MVVNPHITLIPRTPDPVIVPSQTVVEHWLLQSGFRNLCVGTLHEVSRLLGINLLVTVYKRRLIVRHRARTTRTEQRLPCSIKPREYPPSSLIRLCAMGPVGCQPSIILTQPCNNKVWHGTAGVFFPHKPPLNEYECDLLLRELPEAKPTEALMHIHRGSHCTPWYTVTTPDQGVNR